jgi:glucose 1-dehydrogenase
MKRENRVAIVTGGAQGIGVAIAVFLAAQDASYVSGQTIYADGGRLGLNYTVPVADAALD